MGLNKINIKTSLCVVGGGIAGICVAISAARNGIKVVLVNDRPVFGGNASSEVRMWICGIQNALYRETGLLEELLLENLRRNPTKNYYIWDNILMEKIYDENNITALANCACIDAVTKNDHINSITACQMTTQTMYNIQADYFADCSGDSILAPLSGAEFMLGRESKNVFGEKMAVDVSDKFTMGNSCLIQARKVNYSVKFTAPNNIQKITYERLEKLNVNLMNSRENFWYIELGGNRDTVADCEEIKKEVIALAFGIWDCIKNSGKFDADNWELEFIGYFPAKRESRRMIGDYVMTANDMLDETNFYDTVAYGGWSIDDHNPFGFNSDDPPNRDIKVEPYSIPYRCLYSKNIENLFFAGRNISLSHLAMSSARVMATCAVVGQAVGTAISLVDKYKIMPKELSKYIDELQQLLIEDDCFLLHIKRKISSLTKEAEISGKDVRLLENARNGIYRNIVGENRVFITKNGIISYSFKNFTYVDRVKIVFDSDLRRDTIDGDDCERHHNMRCNITDNIPMMSLPKTLTKQYELSVMTKNGKKIIVSEFNNCKRNVILYIQEEVMQIDLTIVSNYGNYDEIGLFSFEIL